MAEFIDASLTQEVVDAKNDLQLQAERAKLIVDSWDGLVPEANGIEEAPIDGQAYARQDAGWAVAAGSGDMSKAAYDRVVYNNHSTGLYDGGLITINTDTTKFDVAAGVGAIVDSTTDTANPTYDMITWAAQNAITVTNIGTTIFTNIYIDPNGNVLQSSVEPTPALRRDNIFLGKIIHQDFVNVLFSTPKPEILANPVNQMSDFFAAIGVVNIKGNQISANGGNLSIDKTAGDIHQEGVNYFIDKKSPNIKFLPAQAAAVFLYGTQTSGTTTLLTQIDPTSYDVAGTVTPIAGGGNTSSNQRVYIFNNALVGIQYGQTTYATLADAIIGVQSEPFVILQDLADNAVLLGIISVTKNATNLADSGDAFFTSASKFGEVSAGTGSLSVSTLQNAYDNSTTPQITTSPSGGAVAVKQGSGLDTDVVTQVENGAGAVVHSVTGEGVHKYADATEQTTAFTDTLKTKLDSVASGSTANSTDAVLLARTNHTGSQAASTISDFQANVSVNSSVAANTTKVTYPSADSTKLAGIEALAQVNAFDFADAPSDGKQYSRKDATWDEILPADEAAPTISPTPSTNYVLDSADLGEWVAVACTKTTDATLAPDGITTAALITLTGTNGSIRESVVDLGGTAGDVRTFSAYVKPVSGTKIQLKSTTGGNVISSFVTATSTMEFPAGVTGGSEALDDGWFRIWMTWELLSTTTSPALELGSQLSGTTFYGAMIQGCFSTSN